MNSEFINSQEHKECCCNVTHGKVKKLCSEHVQFLKLLKFP